MAAFKLLTELVRHFHVFEHNFKTLRELATALFFQFEYESSFSLFADLALLKQSLGETADIETFKDVFVEEVAENVNDFVQTLGKLRLLDILEVFLKHLIEVKHECFGGTISDVDDLFEGHFDCHVNLRVLQHGRALDAANSLTKINHLCYKLFVLDFFSHKFVALVYDKFGEVLSQQLERCWSTRKHVIDQGKFIHFIVADHVD